MKFHPDVLAAHAQFGGDLESMQKLYDWHDLKSEVDRLRSTLMWVQANYAGAPTQQINAHIDAALARGSEQPE